MNVNPDPQPESGGRLTTDQAARVGAEMAAMARAGLPLAPGLRALADELQSRRARRTLRRLADDLDAGLPLDKALAAFGHRLPAHLTGLILAGVRTGRLAQVLEAFATLERHRVDLRRRVWLSLAYPMVLVAVLSAVVVLFGLVIVPTFEKIFKDFGTELPAMTRMLIWTAHGSGWLLVGIAVIALPALVVLGMAPRIAWAQSMVNALPVLGRVWRWQGLAEFSRLAALFLEGQVPLPEALRLTADGVHAADLAAASRRLAGRIEAGAPLAEALAGVRAFPPSLKPYIDSGVQTSRLPEALLAAAETFERRGSVNMTLWEAVLPPFLFFFILCSIGFLVVSLLLPLVSLIQKLS